MSGTMVSSRADFSPAGLFLHADIVVQVVILLLLLASFWCWTIIYGKSAGFRQTKRALDAFEEHFWSDVSVTELYKQLRDSVDGPMATLFVAGMREWERSSGKRGGAALEIRIRKVMRVQVAAEIDVLERHLGFLATVGSTGTFVGLFGTVWGIMNSFKSIAASNSTSLTVVAPGIAEALLATAVGLLAAIPAVIAYNRFSASSDRIADRLDGFVDEFTAILSEHLRGPPR